MDGIEYGIAYPTKNYQNTPSYEYFPEEDFRLKPYA
jgi:hypothetical protein